MFAYLRSRKIKVLEIFSKGERSENQRISREEFIMALKAVSMSFSLGLRVCMVLPPSPGSAVLRGSLRLQNHTRKHGTTYSQITALKQPLHQAER